MNHRDSLLAALVAVVWGVNFVVIDWGLDDVPPLVLLTLRFCVVLVPGVLLVPRPDAGWRVVAAVGVLMSLGQFAFLYLSLAAGMPPGLAALVLQAQVVVTVVLAAGVLHERPTTRQVLGVVVGTAGLVVVALGRSAAVSPLALGLCLLGAMSWGAGNVVSRSSGVAGGLSLTVWSALVVPLPALALSLLLDGPAEVARALTSLSWQAGVSTLYTAVLASLVGYGIFNTLLSRNPPSAVVPWVLLVPVVAMASAWLVLGQRPNVAEAIGGFVMVGGVLATLRAPASPTATRSAGRIAARHQRPTAAAIASSAAGDTAVGPPTSVMSRTPAP